MTSIRRQIVIDADPDAVWEALRAWDALDERLAAGFVTGCEDDGFAWLHRDGLKWRHFAVGVCGLDLA